MKTASGCMCDERFSYKQPVNRTALHGPKMGPAICCRIANRKFASNCVFLAMGIVRSDF